MNDNLNDLEVGFLSNNPRNLNKKMRKRKHLDALLKTRLTKKNSNDIVRTSEDELFLPQRKPSITKSHSLAYHRFWNNFKYILSFGFACIFIIICIALIYANIELKNDVRNLSSRIDEIEKKYLFMNLNNISSTIEQIKTRLNLFEHLKFSLKKQNLEDQVIDDSDQEIDNRLENTINQTVMQWNNQLRSFQDEIKNLDQTEKIQELKTYFEQLSSLVQNSSDKISVILTEFQSNFDQLQNKINECNCLKEPIHFKPSVINNAQLQQRLVPKQTQNKIEVEQIVNQPSMNS